MMDPTVFPAATAERRLSRSARHVSLGLASAMAVLLAGTVARADCSDDINGLMKRRMAAVEAVNKTPKSGGNKLDPIAACPRLRSLAAIEGEATAYLKKNQEWCNLPPDFVEKMAGSYSRTAGFAQKACTVAAMVKKQQQQMQAQQQQQQQAEAPKLPAGPL